MKDKPATVVLDSNVLLKTVLVEAYSQEVMQWLLGAGELINCHAPSWIYLECAHTLQKAGRRFPNLYAPDQLGKDFYHLKSIDLELYAFEPYTDRALELALQFSISVYDGIFLALAEYLHMPFLTDDRRMIACLKDYHAVELISVSEYFGE